MQISRQSENLLGDFLVLIFLCHSFTDHHIHAVCAHEINLVT